MCFSPQRRAIFRRKNYKKRFGAEVFCTFSLANVLLATAPCHFSKKELQKALRTWGALYIFTWKCASRHTVCNFGFLLWPDGSAHAALTSLLFDAPDTRIIEKTQHVATSLTFGACESSFFWLSRYCIFFLLTLLHLICFSSAFQLSILSEVNFPSNIVMLVRIPFSATHISLWIWPQDAPFLVHARSIQQNGRWNVENEGCRGMYIWGVVPCQ